MSDWEECTAAAAEGGATYFFNRRTNASQWHRPAELGGEPDSGGSASSASSGGSCKSWESEEDRTLYDARARLGEQWDKIALLLPGRTGADVQEHWARSIREATAKAATSRALREEAKEAKEAQAMATNPARGGGGGAALSGGSGGGRGRGRSATTATAIFITITRRRRSRAGCTRAFWATRRSRRLPRMSGPMAEGG
jgi:hypothetical protein